MLNICIEQARPNDAAEILTLQKLAYQSEARLYNDNVLPPLTQTLAEIESEFADHTFLKATLETRIIGSETEQVTETLSLVFMQKIPGGQFGTS